MKLPLLLIILAFANCNEPCKPEYRSEIQIKINNKIEGAKNLYNVAQNHLREVDIEDSLKQALEGFVRDSISIDSFYVTVQSVNNSLADIPGINASFQDEFAKYDAYDFFKTDKQLKESRAYSYLSKLHAYEHQKVYLKITGLSYLSLDPTGSVTFAVKVIY